MLYQLSEQFPFAPWSLLRYVTVRSGGALITSLLLSWWLGPRLISWLSDLKFRQDYQPKDAQKPGDATGAADAQAKRGTPTMGGILIVLTLDLSVLLWARWNPLVILVLVVFLAFAGLGLYDDWRKVSKQNADGVSSSFKLLIQFAVGIAAVAYLWRLPSGSALVTQLNIPFVAAKSAILAGGAATVLALLLSVVTIVGASNAVNLTDGMDGLAIGCTIVCTFVFLVMAYVAGNAELARYLLVPKVPGSGELTVVCAALIGSSLGFWWYNCHPASVFMGDTGSLAIGGALGVIAVAIHQPLTLLIAGGVFVVEALSVFLQVGWFKYTRIRFGQGRRILLMSPLHHHFRKKNWSETKVVTRFYIAAILFAVLALSTLKVR
jgi:phospho-N-acetylmuramoyl-pentapeptide-transferase